MEVTCPFVRLRTMQSVVGLLGLALSVLILAGAGPALSFSGGKKTVVITTDAGCDVDDQVVIAHLLLSPEIHVAGIVSTHAPNLLGNDIPVKDKNGALLPWAEITANQARLVLDQLPEHCRCPVFVGSSKPLTSDHRALPNGGVQFIIDTSSHFDKNHRLVILALGAATDIASALIKDPTLADRIEIVALGFESWPGGKDRFNVRNDIKAWQVMMGANLPLTVADGDVCKRDLVIDQVASDKIFAGHGPVGKFLGGLVSKWLARNGDLDKELTGRNAWPIWDESTVAYLLGDTKTKIYKRPKLLDDTSFAKYYPNREISWVTAVDAKRLWQDLDDKMDRVAK